mmetsp:Transcript_102334/g.298391  ORF Transcript_102334/g.298391 Transcript_102334/m.298391 type:complete len:487 (+) Transcript_102334:109-1569(+)
MGADETAPLFKSNRRATGSRPPVYLYFIVGCAALNSVNLGYDIGVNSGVAVLIQEDLGLSGRQIGLFMGILHFLAACGGLMNQAVSDRLGRCRTFTVAQVILLVGVAILFTAGSYSALLVGRMFVGIGVGLGLAIDPLYMAEVSPADCRGMLTAWAEIATNLGVLLGFIANSVFNGLPLGHDWRTMLACGGVLPLVLTVLSLTVMPESPRWLIARGRDAEAEVVLQRTHAADVNVAELVKEIRDQLRVEAEHEGLGWTELLRPDAMTRRMLLVGVGVAFAQQINGSESVVLYSPELFKDAGVARTTSGLFAVTIIVGVVKLIFIVVSALLLDSVGRRPLLILSTCGMAICQLVLSLALATSHGWLAATAVWVFIAFFSVGIGPICWLLAAEVFPLHIRAKAMSLAAFTNRATSGIVALTFLPLSGAMTLSGYYLLFAFFTAGTAVASYYYVPETKQRTLEQLTDFFRELSYGSEKDAESLANRATK